MTDWNRIGLHPHHGINTPLSSLRTMRSGGVGEFLDLKLLIDWVASIGFDMIQLLPLYDSGEDPSPYNVLSAHALNPIYISLHALPGMDSSSLFPLNQEKRLHYGEVLKRKIALLKQYYQEHPTDEWKLFAAGQPWLAAYAQFKAQQDPGSETFYQWLQWLAFSQMQEVKAYAESKNVFLKGDLPILVSPESVDVIEHPELFNKTLAAGAPPDQYSKEGQRWGFPLYKFEALESTDFAYWKGRLKAAESLYHLYRLDHIVGLFRLWGIPAGKKPAEGHYVPEDRTKWGPQGKATLEALLHASSLLPVGEDLGIIPHETRETMHHLWIPGTKVIRWERRWKGDKSFIPFSEYPLCSMTTVSTHDSNSLSTWWEHHPDEAEAFAAFMGWKFEKKLSNEQLIEILRISHHTPSLLHINLLHEYLALFPDLNKQEEARINTPGTISDLNWTYRYPSYLEEIVSHTDLKHLMRELIR